MLNDPSHEIVISTLEKRMKIFSQAIKMYYTYFQKRMKTFSQTKKMYIHIFNQKHVLLMKHSAANCST